MAAVRTNSVLSQNFCLNRGTGQECPLSTLLFDLATEPLAGTIRDVEQASGIVSEVQPHKLALNADDLLLYLLVRCFNPKSNEYYIRVRRNIWLKDKSY